MLIQDALLGRRTVQRLLPEPLPEPVLARALLAAHHAPNHKLTWPWRFTLPGPVALDALARVITILKAQKRGEAAPTPDAPLEPSAGLIVLSQVIDPDPTRAREDYAACACAAQNLMLSLHADGWATKWGTGPATRHPEARRILEVPDNEEVVGFFWYGRAAAPTKAPPRPPLADLVRKLP